jgi:lysophospholipase L1-like esterase
MQKRPWLIAALAVMLWLAIGFYLDGLKAESARHPSVVMLGDSITAWTDWNALLPSFDVTNRGIPGDTTAGVLSRIDDIVAMHPQCVAVMIGINDLLSVNPKSVQQILHNYTAIVDRLSTISSTVIVQSTLVTSHTSENASVLDINRALGEMCRQSGRCLYLDLNSTVAATGAIPDSRDGLHLGPNSYKIWASALAPLLNNNCR